MVHINLMKAYNMSNGCEVICQEEHLSPIMWQQSYVCVKQTLIPDCFRNIVYWGNLHVMKVIQNHEERSYMPQELIKQFNIEQGKSEGFDSCGGVAEKTQISHHRWTLLLIATTINKILQSLLNFHRSVNKPSWFGKTTILVILRSPDGRHLANVAD